MKDTKIYCLTLICMVFLLTSGVCFCQEIYQNGWYHLVRSNPDVPLLSAFDVNSMGDKYLPEFPLKYIENHQYSYYEGRHFEFSGISIYVGLYPSVPEAEAAVLERINHTVCSWDEWPSDWEKVGDTAWYHILGNPQDGSSFVSGVVFIRKNAFILLYMSAKYGPNLRSIAAAIDRDILSGADYLKVEDKISPPVITAANLSKSVLREGEISFLTFQASDSSGSSLKYLSNVGYDIMKNVWYIKASRYSSLGEPFEGQHTIQCWVMNENNLYSSIKELTVTF